MNLKKNRFLIYAKFEGNQFQAPNENPEWIIKNMKMHPEWNAARVRAGVKNKIKHVLKRGERYQGELNKEESLLLNLMQVTISQISLL